MRALDPAVASKLTKVCGLLGSDHDGERAAAAWQATRLLRQAGLTWADLFAPVPPPRTRAAAPVRAPHAARVQWALGFQDRLTPWESGFLRDISRRRRLSARQAAMLETIVRELEERAG